MKFFRKLRGSRMRTLYTTNENDVFYDTIYGGLEEKANDDDFQPDTDSTNGSDSTDTDFSDTETDSAKEEIDITKKSKKNVYMDPRLKKSGMTNIGKPVEKKEKKKFIQFPLYYERKSFRSSTNEKREHTEEAVKIREEKMKLKPIFKKSEFKVYTQEEMLTEAKITEKINLESLDRHNKWEIERKRKNKKSTYNIDTNKIMTISRLNGDGTDYKNTIHFTCPDDLQKYFSVEKFNTEPSKQKFCKITDKPAKYIDPVTDTPYHSVDVFKAIRKSKEIPNNSTSAPTNK
ncbi:Vacuolar protein sorting-associated protein 72 [Intoshia linei]|uniref:Vacuolar protein sorting-associated protein 72 homolog n=1 Tax=Intoshia linei TaxID=1819745 RepID=A0A177AWF2_9BILA|nr:Vacuolar protein sorting-associated protein 72 [Intoshia linei]